MRDTRLNRRWLARKRRQKAGLGVYTGSFVLAAAATVVIIASAVCAFLVMFPDM